MPKITRNFSIATARSFWNKVASSNSQPPQSAPQNFPPAKSSAYAKDQVAKDERVYVKLSGINYSTKLPENFRRGHFPLYTAPGISYVSLVKRVSLGIGFVGIYGAYLVHSANYIDPEIATAVAAMSALPFPLVTYFTRNYVTRIFRLYDTDKPQTVENLTNEETLIMEKMMSGGKRYYNELVKLDDLKLAKTWYGMTVWEHPDDIGRPKYFYVEDDIGGVKMDRIWGKVEKNSGINNGRLLLED